MNDSQSDSELLKWVLKDTGINYDGAGMVGQTDFNRLSVTGKAAELALSGRCYHFAMIQEAGYGYAGGDIWEAETKALAEPAPITIWQLPYGSLSNGKKMTNTLGEPLSIVPLAKKLGWKTLGVIAPEFHLPRAVMSYITVALAEYPELKIYGILGLALDPKEKVVHSQGILEATREELIELERQKIEEYIHRGWLASYAAAMQYLDQRDAR